VARHRCPPGVAGVRGYPQYDPRRIVWPRPFNPVSQKPTPERCRGRGRAVRVTSPVCPRGFPGPTPPGAGHQTAGAGKRACAWRDHHGPHGPASGCAGARGRVSALTRDAPVAHASNHSCPERRAAGEAPHPASADPPPTAPAAWSAGGAEAGRGQRPRCVGAGVEVWSAAPPWARGGHGGAVQVHQARALHAHRSSWTITPEVFGL